MREYIMLTRKNGIRPVNFDIEDVEVREEIERTASEFEVKNKAEPAVFLLPLRRKKTFFLLGEAHFVEKSKYEQRPHHFVHAVLVQEKELESYIPEFFGSLDRRFFQGSIEMMEKMEQAEIQGIFDLPGEEKVICSSEMEPLEKLQFLIYMNYIFDKEKRTESTWKEPRTAAQLFLELMPTWYFKEYGLIVNGVCKNRANKFKFVFLEGEEDETENKKGVSDAEKKYPYLAELMSQDYAQMRKCYVETSETPPYIKNGQTMPVMEKLESTVKSFLTKDCVKEDKKEMVKCVEVTCLPKEPPVEEHFLQMEQMMSEEGEYNMNLDWAHSEIRALSDSEKKEMRQDMIRFIYNSSQINYRVVSYLILFLFEYDFQELKQKMENEEFRVIVPYDMYAMQNFIRKLPNSEAQKIYKELKMLMLEESFGNQDDRKSNRKVRRKVKI